MSSNCAPTRPTDIVVRAAPNRSICSSLANWPGPANRSPGEQPGRWRRAGRCVVTARLPGPDNRQGGHREDGPRCALRRPGRRLRGGGGAGFLHRMLWAPAFWRRTQVLRAARPRRDHVGRRERGRGQNGGTRNPPDGPRLSASGPPVSITAVRQKPPCIRASPVRRSRASNESRSRVAIRATRLAWTLQRGTCRCLAQRGWPGWKRPQECVT